MQLTSIIGFCEDEDIAIHLHELEHRAKVEEIILRRDDLARRRIRTQTATGTECTIALPRHQRLRDGAVLLLEEDRAIIVRAQPERWLTLEPADRESALQLGYFAGNMHWRVRFQGTSMSIGIEQDEAYYLERLGPLLAGRSIRRMDDA